jgi:hypothetical protein
MGLKIGGVPEKSGLGLRLKISAGKLRDRHSKETP